MNHYIESILKITSLRCPRAVVEKKNSQGKVTAKIAQPWNLIDARETESSIDIALHVPIGYSVNDLIQETDAIYAACGAYVTIRDRGGVAVVSISKKDFPDTIPFDPKMLESCAGRTVLLGYDQMGNPIFHNFRVPHMLIGAMPGYGKTDLIRWIILQLVHRFTPDQIHIDIIDGKGFSFLPFRGVPHIRRIARDLAGASSIMKDAKRIMNNRSSQIWDEDNRNMTDGFRWHMVFVDELAVLSPGFQITKDDKKLATYTYADMAAVACVGREAGVGMVLCTQRPDANVVHPQVKQAMDVAIAFRTKTLTNSEIILDHGGAQLLPQNKPGRGIYSASTDTIFQAPYIGKDDVWEKILSPYKYEWSDMSDERPKETNDLDDVY